MKQWAVKLTLDYGLADHTHKENQTFVKRREVWFQPPLPSGLHARSPPLLPPLSTWTPKSVEESGELHLSLVQGGAPRPEIPSNFPLFNLRGSNKPTEVGWEAKGLTRTQVSESKIEAQAGKFEGESFLSSICVELLCRLGGGSHLRNILKAAFSRHVPSSPQSSPVRTLKSSRHIKREIGGLGTSPNTGAQLNKNRLY